jgi:hypothetical protein
MHGNVSHVQPELVELSKVPTATKSVGGNDRHHGVVLDLPGAKGGDDPGPASTSMRSDAKGCKGRAEIFPEFEETTRQRGRREYGD